MIQRAGPKIDAISSIAGLPEGDPSIGISVLQEIYHRIVIIILELIKSKSSES